MSGIPSTKRLIFSLLFLIIFSLLPFSSIRAEEGTHSVVSHPAQTSVNDINHDNDHNGDRSGDLIDLFYRFINFTLLVIILFVVIKKTKVMDHLSTRSEEIKKRLSDLKREKEEAESRYQELETKLRDFDTERKGILDQYRKEGLAEKKKIISEAKERVKQILEQSDLTIQQEMESARDRLKREVVELAAQRAQEIITKEMDEKDQDNLINEFIERVGKIN